MATQTATKFGRISVQTTALVARIALSNPPLNVIDIAMMDELSSAVEEIGSNPGISVLVLSGGGKSFSVGVDVAAHTPDKVGIMLAKFHRVIRALIATKNVTIAAVHGHCLGGGAELAMVCDLAHTAEDAQWGFPEIQLGCFPPVAVTALSALIGQKRAADLILTGRTVSGKEAAEIGLANNAVGADRLNTVLEETVDKLCRLSPAALAITKKANYAWDSVHFDKGLGGAEKIYLEELMKTEDAQEGIHAFMEKRAPKWKGR